MRARSGNNCNQGYRNTCATREGVFRPRPCNCWQQPSSARNPQGSPRHSPRTPRARVPPAAPCGHARKCSRKPGGGFDATHTCGMQPARTKVTLQQTGCNHRLKDAPCPPNQLHESKVKESWSQAVGHGDLVSMVFYRTTEAVSTAHWLTLDPRCPQAQRSADGLRHADE